MEREDCGCGCTGMDKAPKKETEAAQKGDTCAKPVEAKERREGK